MTFWTSTSTCLEVGRTKMPLQCTSVKERIKMPLQDYRPGLTMADQTGPIYLMKSLFPTQSEPQGVSHVHGQFKVVD